MSTPLLFRRRGFIVTLYAVLSSLTTVNSLCLQVVFNRGHYEEVPTEVDEYCQTTAKDCDVLQSLATFELHQEESNESSIEAF